MQDFRTAREKRTGYWIEQDSTVSCVVMPDGLLVIFLLEEVEEILDKNYPHEMVEDGTAKAWYFSETKDRECARCELL